MTRPKNTESDAKEAQLQLALATIRTQKISAKQATHDFKVPRQTLNDSQAYLRFDGNFTPRKRDLVICAHKRYNMMKITEESRGHWNLLIPSTEGLEG